MWENAGRGEANDHNGLGAGRMANSLSPGCGISAWRWDISFRPTRCALPNLQRHKWLSLRRGRLPLCHPWQNTVH